MEQARRPALYCLCLDAVSLSAESENKSLMLQTWETLSILHLWDCNSHCKLPRHPTCNQSAITLLPLKLDSLHTHLVSSLFPCYLHIVLCLDTPGEVSVLFAAVRTLLDFLPVPHVLRFDLDFVSSVLQSATLSFAVCSFVWFLSFELLAFNFPCTAFVFNKYLWFKL